MSDLERMTLGEVVDYTIAYNERQKRTEHATKEKNENHGRHRATQAEIDAFFG